MSEQPSPQAEFDWGGRLPNPWMKVAERAANPLVARQGGLVHGEQTKND